MMKLSEIEGKDITAKILKGDFPYKISTGRPSTWRPVEGEDTDVYVTIKTTEPRGIPATVMKDLAYRTVDFSGKVKKISRDIGMYKVQTLSGSNISDSMKNFYSFKPNGLVFRFKNVSEEQAKNALMEILSKIIEHVSKRAKEKEEWRAGAGERKKEASKAYAASYKKEREELYAKYGKRNVQSVTARQIGGDDGYHWNVLINNVPMVNGLTLSQVPYYKRQAYDRLLKQRGKV